MTTLDADKWDELLRAEIATADAPASAESFCRVARAYEAADFPNAALAVLRKAASFGVENRMVLPALLGAFRKQRQFAELNTAVQAGLAIGDRNVALGRELALALACLNQMPTAELEWVALIRAGCMQEADWLDCARFVMNCPDPASLVQLTTAIQERHELHAHSLAGYCAIKHLIDRDMAAARRVLRKTDPARAGVGHPDISLDLAILAWRLQKYSKAETAATSAAASDNAPSVAKHVLASIRSFAGDASLLRAVSLPTARMAADQVSSCALTVPRKAAAWGFLHRDGLDSLKAWILDLAAEPDMAVPEDSDPVATFSILSEELKPDPYHILCGVDWSWPHVLLQRKPDGDALHFFVEAPGDKDWLWEEVRPETGGDGNGLASAPGRQPSATWAAVLRELEDGTEDEL